MVSYGSIEPSVNFKERIFSTRIFKSANGSAVALSPFICIRHWGKRISIEALCWRTGPYFGIAVVYLSFSAWYSYHLPLRAEQSCIYASIAVESGLGFALSSSYVCTIVTVEICAAGANFWFHIGD